MVQPSPARIGDPLEAIETPALVVDLEAYERNLDAMAVLMDGARARLRPHAKTHKSPLVALEQIARGAIGVCCQKVAEAEVMVEGGVRDLLVSNEVVGRSKLDRLAALARSARITVCVDHAGNVADLSAAARAFESELGVLVEIDVGSGRCGVAPGAEAVALARQVAAAEGLRFDGLQAYQGRAQHIRDYAERRAAIARAAAMTRETVAALAQAGLDCAVLAGGGTGSLLLDLELGPLTELQAGSYVFMDADYPPNRDARGGAAIPFENALFVLATVMSTPRPGTAVLDAGLKALAFDSGLPLVVGRSDLRYVGPSDEHGRLELDQGAELAHGAHLRLIPGHCDPTVNLHDWFVGIRGVRVERVWPVAARGALG